MLFALLAESAAAFHATARPSVCGRAGFAAMQQKGEAGGMRTRPLGGSDIMVSELGLGTQRWGGTDFNSPDEEMCHAMLDVATEAGVNLVDTAEQYPIPSGRGKNAEGATEAIIGSWMAKDKLARRSKLVIASKITGGANVTPRNLQKDLEGSLKRLGNPNPSPSPSPSPSPNPNPSPSPSSRPNRNPNANPRHRLSRRLPAALAGAVHATGQLGPEPRVRPHPRAALAARHDVVRRDRRGHGRSREAGQDPRVGHV